MPPQAADVPELRPGQRVDLHIVSDSGVHALRTSFERLDALSGRMVVAWPTEHLRLFPLRPGQHVLVEHSRPEDALYTCETLLESASTEEPPRLVLRPLGEWQRVQRRQTARHPVDMRPSQAARLLPNGDRASFSASLSDLSAGGLRLLASIELHVDDQLELAFGTPSGGAELRLRLTVVRVSSPPASSQPVWDVGCQFVEPSEREREQIVQFIVTQQSAIARAG
jgi:c-di-GMP-binding flagellar brake protein YcgR